MFAAKSIIGQEFRYSKRLVISIGKKPSLKKQAYIIKSLNETTAPNFKVNEGETWHIYTDDYLEPLFATYKAIVGKDSFKVRLIC
jgi:hypothetical protein